ncbi:MAG: hypothetical protein ABEI53_03640 [Candidatus Magasanikbacteria bacterium]
MMKKKVINIYKEKGETPLEALKRLEKIRPELKEQKKSYAGKLDPMAEGVLLVLVGEETKKQKDYQNLDKEYLAEIIFGISTDSGDLMGLIENIREVGISKAEVADYCSEIEGVQKIKIPAFSGYEIKGEPLFWWARQDKLGQIEIPKKQMKVYSASFLGFEKKASQEVFEKVKQEVKEVNGDFRQEEIIENWRKNFEKEDYEFPLVRLKIQCSSGTYVRSLARELGGYLNVPSSLFSLVRTKIGIENETYWAGDALRVNN